MFSPRLVASEYVKSWLALDLVTAWPVVMTPDALRLTQRVVKLARVVRLYRGLEKIQKELKSVLVMPVKVFLMTFLPTHICACM